MHFAKDLSRLVSRLFRFGFRLLVPVGLWEDPNTERRAGIVAVVAALAAVIAGVRAATYGSAGQLVQASTFIATALLAGLVVLLVRKRGSVTVAANLLITGLVITATLTACWRGGVGSPLLFALGLMPAVATLLAGARFGVVWLLVVWLDLLAVAGLPAAGIELADRVAPADRFAIDLAASLLLPPLMFAVVAVYEWAMEKAVRERISAQRARADALEQAKILRASRISSLGTLAGGIGHEINNPLSSIVANLAFVARGLRRSASGGDQSELLAAVTESQEGAARIHRIVRELRVFSRAEQKKVEALDPVQVVSSAIALVQNEIRHRARLSSDHQEVPLVAANEARLAQVFVNLLVNAAQALPEDDPVHNEVETRIASDDGGRICVSIRDTGCGIPAADLPRIFDPFFSTKEVGEASGLGLAICHQELEQIGGEIEIASEVGVGTTVTILLPPTDATPTPVAELEAIDPTTSRRARVLVIDDDAAVGLAFRRILEEHDVVVAGGGQRALDLFSAGEDFDIVFCDLMMPHVAGMDVYAAVQGLDPVLAKRFIFITGGAFTSRAREFMENLDRPCLRKPFEPQDIRLYVRQYLARASQTQSGGSAQKRP